MPKSIERVQFPPRLERKKRVAAYARVSSGKDEMLHSLSAQVSYYSSLIQGHEDWEYAGVYADEAVTGTKESRDNFQKLLAECRAGAVDLVITKSISRFARNTVTLLQTVRELKTLGVDVYFEEQNIHTLSSEGELMMTILASYAQEESRSSSENQKWRIKKNFEAGIPWNGTVLGYRHNGERYELVPEEAEIVRRIFAEYLDGAGVMTIAKKLTADGILSPRGGTWHATTIRKILVNYAYTGNLLLQKTFSENHITKRRLVNRGEMPMYHAEHTHQPIIDLGTFQAVQAEIARRAEHYNGRGASRAVYPFTSKIVCAGCGCHYRRKVTASRVVWICGTYNVYGKGACPISKQIPEKTLLSVTTDVLDLSSFDEAAFKEKVAEIYAGSNNTLRYIFLDGSEETALWKDRSRAESWTPEMRAAARQRILKQRGEEQCRK